MLYTRKGDGGTSGLFGTPERFPKDSPVYEALGTVDELNSLLGVCFAIADRQAFSDAPSVGPFLRDAQEKLFIIQADLAGAGKKIVQSHVDELEENIAHVEGKIRNPHSFVVPGATELSAFLDFARAVARRAERAAVHASGVRKLSPAAYAYLNRLSSLLYALARFSATMEKKRELAPVY